MTPILFHPPLVHFPIAFYVLELVLLLFWAAKRDPAHLRFARFAFRLGYFCMLAAMIAGLVDARGIPSTVRRHFFSALSVFGVYSARFVIWQGLRENDKNYPWIQLAGAAAGTALVLVTAYLGGKLVFS